MDVLKQVEEALEMACGIFRSHAGEEQRAEECTAALTALRGLEWRPMAEMEEFEPTGVRVGFNGEVSWVMAPYLVTRPDEVPKMYTHFCRPILPTPPTREVENAG
jgi:hypothetical protein